MRRKSRWPGQRRAKRIATARNEEPAIAAKPQKDDVAAAPPEAPAANEPAVPRQYLTLGSADPQSGYSGLYYFDNHGAALECHRTERQEISIGRGSTAATLAGSPCRARWGAEPKSTSSARALPAALAKASGDLPPGLAVGDVIQSIDGQPIADERALDDYLTEKTRPGQSVVLSVVRKASATNPLTFTAAAQAAAAGHRASGKAQYATPAGIKFLPTTDPLSLLLTLDTIGTRPIKASETEIAGLPSLYHSNWQVERQGADFIEFSFTLDEVNAEENRQDRLAEDREALLACRRPRRPRRQRPII